MDNNSPDANLAAETLGSNPQLRFGKIEELGSRVRAAITAARKYLFSEQHDVRASVKRNLYTGRTYNSVENIAQFFAERGMPPPSGFTRRPDAPPAAAPNRSAAASAALRSRLMRS